MLWVCDVDGEIPAFSDLGTKTRREIIKNEIDTVPEEPSPKRSSLRSSP